VIFSKIQVQFRILIRIHNLDLRIRILQEVSDPGGSGSPTLVPKKALKKVKFQNVTGTGI
jgi:hypothetical protein